MNLQQTKKVWYQWEKLSESAPARFKKYGELDQAKIAPEQQGEFALRALATVAWNTGLAESLTPILQAVEIGLRNWLDHAVTLELKKRSQPFSDEWLLHPPAWLHAHDLDLIEKAREKLQRQVNDGKRTRFGHDDLVATASFTLWSNVIKSNDVWSALSKFKGGQLIIGEDKKSLHKVFDDIRNLRNRAYHLEPIFCQVDLPSIHAEAVKRLQILDPRLSSLMSSFDRFPQVFDQGRGSEKFRDVLYRHYGLDKLEDV